MFFHLNLWASVLIPDRSALLLYFFFLSDVQTIRSLLDVKMKIMYI